ncbi:MAG TPA: MarR family winged helix-turn-helix transcriptional regulator [Candidatus Dormibacteraeota bacterium]|nr:MarR family winged helix-turn-helix transcriptional regulator [Candidatus Dormibacteraeota bacterium]
MSDEFVPGLRFESGAHELWAMLIGVLPEWEQRMTRASKATGLSPVSVWALVQLDPRQPITQKELAGRLKCNPSTVVDPTDRLEEAGYVVRRPNPHDRRENELVVTSKGAALRRRLIARLLEPPAALGDLSTREQSRFSAILEAVIKPAG